MKMDGVLVKDKQEGEERVERVEKKKEEAELRQRGLQSEGSNSLLSVAFFCVFLLFLFAGGTLLL
ncbi:hypothetical protein LINPERPRIM_LOCUS37159 [Linum perenne]